MDKDYLILKRAAASSLFSERGDDDYDVLCEGAVVGRIIKSAAAPVGQPWLAYWRCRGFYDAADHCALTQHVVVVIAPLAEQAGSRRAFEDQIVLVHVPPSFRR